VGAIVGIQFGENIFDVSAFPPEISHRTSGYFPKGLSQETLEQAKDLSQTAKNPIRLDPGQPSVIFRVRMDNLKSRTTYYYTVDWMEATGAGYEGKSTVKQFTTP
jgi:hypothetical protein